MERLVEREPRDRWPHAEQDPEAQRDAVEEAQAPIPAAPRVPRPTPARAASASPPYRAGSASPQHPAGEEPDLLDPPARLGDRPRDERCRSISTHVLARRSPGVRKLRGGPTGSRRAGPSASRVPACARVRAAARYVYCGSSIPSAASAAPPPRPPARRPWVSATSRPHRAAGTRASANPAGRPPKSRLEPHRQEGESDADGDGGRGAVLREMARQPVRREPGGGEGEQDEQVVGGVEPEAGERGEGQGQRQEGLRQVPARGRHSGTDRGSVKSGVGPSRPSRTSQSW